jgi:hypothetical protein
MRFTKLGLPDKRSIGHKHHYHNHVCTHCGKLISPSHRSQKKDEYHKWSPEQYAEELSKDLKWRERRVEERKEWDL